MLPYTEVQLPLSYPLHFLGSHPLGDCTRLGTPTSCERGGACAQGHNTGAGTQAPQPNPGFTAEALC